METLGKRIVVAIIGIPLILLSVYFGHLYFTAFCALIASLALYEVYDASKKIGGVPNIALGLIFTVFSFISSGIFILDKDFISLSLRFVVGIPLFTLGVMISELFSKKEKPFLNIALSLGAYFIVTPSLIALSLIREFGSFASIGFANIPLVQNFGLLMICAIFAAIWSCDTFAYFFGLKFGKHKMMPRVSPKKSWEGAIAGFIFGSMAFALVAHLAAGLDLANSIVLGAIVGIIGQIGDLAESLLKRDANIKDSGSMLPGHGGFWDRFDSIIFAAPIVFIYLIITLR